MMLRLIDLDILDYRFQDVKIVWKQLILFMIKDKNLNTRTYRLTEIDKTKHKNYRLDTWTKIRYYDTWISRLYG